MKTSSKILLALAATAAFSLVHPASANLAANGDPPSPGLSESNKTSRLEYHDEWRKLWEDHITGRGS
jgi:hypothetical protein